MLEFIHGGAEPSLYGAWDYLAANARVSSGFLGKLSVIIRNQRKQLNNQWH